MRTLNFDWNPIEQFKNGTNIIEKRSLKCIDSTDPLPPLNFSELTIQIHLDLPSLTSFAQWQYHNQWGSPEVWLLLVENFNQYPATMRWNIPRRQQFLKGLNGRFI